MARHAGQYAASRAIPPNSTGARSKVVGSKTPTANKLDLIRREAATYASSPKPQPDIAIPEAFPRIIHPMFDFRAPKAILTANSRLRSETIYEITPNRPTAARRSATMAKLPMSRVVKRRCATDSETRAARVVVSYAGKSLSSDQICCCAALYRPCSAPRCPGESRSTRAVLLLAPLSTWNNES